MAPKLDKPTNWNEPTEITDKKFQRNKIIERSKRSMSVGELEKRSKQRNCSLIDDGSNKLTMGSATVLPTKEKIKSDNKKTSTYSRFIHFCRKLRCSINSKS